jgi:hypothetical protein
MPSSSKPGSNGPWVNSLGILGGEVPRSERRGMPKNIFEYGRDAKLTKAMFAGAKAKTADLEQLRKAQKLRASGADDYKVLNETGWFRGADGEWRHEIDDRRATLTPLARYALHVTGEAKGPASTILHHPELYEAYPELGKIKTRMRYDSNAAPFGSFSPADNSIQIVTNPNDRDSTPEIMMLHEFPHSIQEEEGFGRGGSLQKITEEFEAEKRAAGKRRQILQAYLDSGRMDAAWIGNARREIESLDARLDELTADNAAWKHYRRLMGEVEARNVEARKDFTPEQRRTIAPWESEDVFRHRQIHR